ncbi:MAG: hypothetical protein DRP64_09215, partial [Verrucomicrobia bacterium]
SAWQRIVCLDKLRKEYPNSLEILDRTLTATTVFLTTYPNSENKGKIIQMRNQLYEVKARKVFDEAAFYAKVPKKPEAAMIYYEQMIEEYPKSKLVPEAHMRIAEIKHLMTSAFSEPVAPSPKPPPLTTEKVPENAEE